MKQTVSCCVTSFRNPYSTFQTFKIYMTVQFIHGSSETLNTKCILLSKSCEVYHNRNILKSKCIQMASNTFVLWKHVKETILE